MNLAGWGSAEAGLGWAGRAGRAGKGVRAEAGVLRQQTDLNLVFVTEPGSGLGWASN